MTKEDLQNRIEQVAYDGATGGCNQAVIEREAKKLAYEIVKLFAIPVVIKSCDTCKNLSTCRFWAEAPENGKTCKFYIEHVL